MIPKETIEEIFEAAKIEEVIKDFLHDLKKKGVNYWACCPFHNEKTPSFSVSPIKGIYKCFGCGKGGNSINFLMEYDHCTYPEALKYLAKKYNIFIEEVKPTLEQKEFANKKESLFLINKFAHDFFQYSLNKDEGGLVALNYLKKRGFKKDVIEKFELGYSPKLKNSFTKHALESSYQKEYLKDAGLTSFNNNKDGVDIFRDRLIFPIHNYSGKVLGFGGRALNSNHKAKYLNSPENLIYQKSEVLYGLYFNKHDIAKNDNCFIVEGYTDVISMSQLGIQNVISASGTALSEKQIRLINRITRNITLLFDGDEAGQKASFKTIDLILAQGMNVQIVSFPKGEDPDSYTKKLNLTQFLTFLKENSIDFINYKINLLSKESLGNPVKKVAMIKNIAKSISIIPERLLRLEYCKISSNLIDVDESEMLKEIEIQLKKEAAREINIVSDTENIVKTKINISEKWEREILRILLRYGNHNLEFQNLTIKAYKYIFEELESDNIEFMNVLYREILLECKSLIMQTKEIDVQYFINHNNFTFQKIVIDLISNKYSMSNKWQENHKIFVENESSHLESTIEKAILSLKKSYVKNNILLINKKLKEEEEEEEITNLLTKLNSLNQVLLKINNSLSSNIK